MMREQWFLPDWATLGDGGRVHHVETIPGTTLTKIVMNYGDEWIIDSRVTPEMRAADHEERRARAIASGAHIYSATFRFTVERERFRCVVVGKSD